MNRFALLILALTLMPNMSFAHPGRTDANGCHTNKKTGEYHCHNSGTTGAARTTARTEARTTARAVVVGDKNCSDFATQALAQEFYLSQGGPALDPHDLDRDHDGVACEDNK